jgi:hypothetical protein
MYVAKIWGKSLEISKNRKKINTLSNKFYPLPFGLLGGFFQIMVSL